MAKKKQYHAEMRKNKKRLMILIWDMGNGGVQKRVKDLVIDIGNNYPEWEVNLLIKLKKKSFYTEEIRKKTKVKINYFYFTGLIGRSKSLYSLIWIAKSYLQLKPDVCLTFLDHFSIIMVVIKNLTFWQKTKLVLNEGILTSQYIRLHHKKPWIWKLLIQNTYKYADRLIVPTKSIKNDLVNNFGVPQKKVKIIKNWTLLKPKKEYAPIYDLIYIGRLDIEKRPLLLLNILSILKKDNPNIKLCILGSGKLETQFTKKVRTLKLSNNVHYPGYVSNLSYYLLRSKIFVLATLNEGFPNAVLEAGILGIPTVTNYFAGVYELIEDGVNGFISRSDPEMISNIKFLLKNPKIRKRYGKNMQDRVIKYHSINNQSVFIKSLLS